MIFDRVKEILAEKLMIPEDKITMDSTFSDLGLDSLDLFEMLMEADDEFGVTLETEENLTTVGALVERIESLQK